MKRLSRTTRRLMMVLAFFVAGGLVTQGAVAADKLPGKGVKVQPLKSSIPEETFQTLLVMKALEKLGYDVQPIKEVTYPVAYVTIANGDATFMADSWDPLHKDFYQQAGGDKKLYRKGVYVKGALQGYLMDKKTAEKYHITNIAQLKDPKLAKLFDADGNGKADLAGCNPGWGCEKVIEHQIKAYGLSDTVEQKQGSYSAIIANTIARYRQGKPILYYTWTPYWVSGVLKPGKDVVWLQVPFSSLPGKRKNVDTALPDGKNYGFQANSERIVANRKWAMAHPSAAKLFSIMKLSAHDISAQNLAMQHGQSSHEDIERQTEGWINAHQKTFNHWVEVARKAAK